MTIAEILTAAESVVKKDFRAAEPAALLQSDALLWVKEAYDIIVDQLRDYVDVQSFNATNAQVEYDLPADCFGDIDGILAISVAGVGLDRAFWLEVLREYRAAPLTLGGKTSPQVFTKWDTDKYAILPAPTTGGGLAVLVYYVKEAALPTLVSDTVPRYFASGFKQALTDYVISRALDSLNGAGAGQAYFDRFMASINAKKAVKFLRAAQYDNAMLNDEANQ